MHCCSTRNFNSRQKNKEICRGVAVNSRLRELRRSIYCEVKVFPTRHRGSLTLLSDRCCLCRGSWCCCGRSTKVDQMKRCVQPSQRKGFHATDVQLRKTRPSPSSEPHRLQCSAVFQRLPRSSHVFPVFPVSPITATKCTRHFHRQREDSAG